MKLLLYIFLLLFSGWVHATGAVIASIAEDSITKQDFLDFARSSAQLRTYLQIPNGSEILFNMFINNKLLLKEGQSLGIKRPEQAPANDILYAQIVQHELLTACEPPSDSEMLNFYANNPKLFSTPLYLRLRRISFKAATEKTIPEAQQELLDIKRKLETNQLEFAQAVKQFSQDQLSINKEGDLGYLPITDYSNPAFESFLSAKEQDFIGPVTEKTGLVNLYQVTARREPILDSYDAVKEIIPEEYLKHCNKERYENLINDLKKKWSVTILVDDVSSVLQTQ